MRETGRMRCIRHFPLEFPKNFPWVNSLHCFGLIVKVLRNHQVPTETGTDRFLSTSTSVRTSLSVYQSDPGIIITKIAFIFFVLPRALDSCYDLYFFHLLPLSLLSLSLSRA